MARTFSQAGPDKISYSHQSFLDGATKVAYSCWVYPAGSGDYQTIFTQIGAEGGGTGGTAGVQILQAVGNDTLYISFRGPGSTASNAGYSGGSLTAGTWQHLLVQYDGTQGTEFDRIKTYVNGSLLTSIGTTAATTLGTTDQPFVFGEAVSGGAHFGGRLCEPAIWTGVVLDSTARTGLAAGDPANAYSVADLKFYAPWDSTYTSGVNDIIASATGTLTGTSIVSHPSGVPTSNPSGGTVTRTRVIFFM